MAVTVEELQILISAEVAEALKGLKSVQKTIREVNQAAMAPARAVTDAMKQMTSSIQEATSITKETTAQATEPVTAAMRKEQERLKKIVEFQKQTAQDIDDAVNKMLQKETLGSTKQADALRESVQEMAAIPKEIGKAQREAWEQYMQSQSGIYDIDVDPAQLQVTKDIEDAIGRMKVREKAERELREEIVKRTAAEIEAAKAHMNDKQRWLVDNPTAKMSDYAAPQTPTAPTDSVSLWQQVMQQYYAKIDYIKKMISDAGGDSGSRLAKTIGTIKGALHSVSNAAKRTGENIGAVFRKAGAAISSVIQKANRFAQTIGKAFKRVQQGFSSSGKEGKKSLGYIAGAIRRTLVMSSLYAVLRTITGGITEGFKNLALASKTANATMSALATSALYLKNSIGAALMPIVQAFTPAITAMADKIVSLLNIFGMLSARIFNNATTYTVAKKAAVDYAKTVKGAMNQLAGFDELNVLQQNTPGMPNPASMFEQVAIPQGTISLAEQIKKLFSGMLSDSEWYKIKEAARAAAAGIAEAVNAALVDTDRWGRIGRTIAEGINTAFAFVEGFSDKLNWSGIGTALSVGLNSAFASWDSAQMGKAIYKTLNGVVSTIYTFFTQTKWGDLGKKLATGINTAIAGADFAMIGRTIASKWNALMSFFHDFIQEFDWKNTGKSIADTINGWFAEMDWAKTGKTLSDGAIGAFSMIGEAVKSVNWQQIGEDIKTFLVSIDWGGIVAELAAVVGNAFGALVSLIWGMLKDSFLSIGNYFKEEIEEAGGNIALGLFNGILHGLGDIVKWQYDHIFKPFLDGFMELFGINSPSTVMFDQGVFIMQGLGNGITSLREKTLSIFSGIVSDIKTSVGDIITYINGDFKKDWTTAWEGVQSKFKTIWDKMQAHASNVVVEISRFTESLSRKIKNFLNGDMDSDDEDYDYGVPDAISGAAPPVKARKMAKGGVVSQPTLAWTGEYAGASSNPEIIAPQSIMRETVVEANAPMVAAMYDMARMVVQAIEENATVVEQDPDAMFRVWQKKANNYRKFSGGSVLI